MVVSMRRRRHAILLLPLHAAAHSHYQDYIPNGRLVPGVPDGPSGWHAVGHTSPDPMHEIRYVTAGFKRNRFGVAFMKAGRQWTEGLCRADSDDDGLSNGQELGDPECVWRVGAAPHRTHNISHPGLTPLELASWTAKRRSDLRPPKAKLGKKPAKRPAAIHATGFEATWWIGHEVETRTFTDALFYYQYVIIPLLIACAVALSLGACACTCGGRRRCCRPVPWPSPLGVFAMYYLLFVVGVGCGVHRYFSHKSFTATKPLKLFLAFLSLLVGQGGPVDWAYVHR